MNGRPLSLNRSLLALLALVAALGLSSLPPAIAQSMEDADNLLIGNKFKQAEDAYRGLLNDDTTGDAYAGLAVALAKQSWPAKILEAEKVLRKAKSLYPDNPNVM